MWCGVTGQPGGGVILPCWVCKGGGAKTPVYHNDLAALQTQASVDSLRSQASRHSRLRVAQTSIGPTAVCCLGTLPLLSLCCMQDVLGHPNARVFVSHCGLHSVYEAAFHGVPVVGVPFMFEQVRSTHAADIPDDDEDRGGRGVDFAVFEHIARAPCVYSRLGWRVAAATVRCCMCLRRQSPVLSSLLLELQ